MNMNPMGIYLVILHIYFFLNVLYKCKLKNEIADLLAGLHASLTVAKLIASLTVARLIAVAIIVEAREEKWVVHI
jgi:hypothetical protein